MKTHVVVIVVLLLAVFVGGASCQEKLPAVTLAKDGKAVLSIFVVAEPAPPAKKKKTPERSLDKSAQDLRRCLQKMTGAEFTLTMSGSFATNPKPGIYVGQARDFSWVKLPKDLQPDEYLLRSTADGQLLLVGGGETGMSHAIYALLEKLGCRWYFPGSVWEIIPSRPTVALAVDERRKADVSLQRRLAVGHGLHSPAIARDYDDWTRRNRLPGEMKVFNSHIWPGISPERDFAAHPEWFALVNGKRQTSQPCYSHPDVIARGVAQSLAYLNKNPQATMVSTSAPDGGGFCECELCRHKANVAKIYPAHGPAGLYGMTPDGKEVSVVSETIFRYANEVAVAVAKKYPGKLVGMIAYSSYSHPPSFELRPNVYVEITQGYRRTPLTLTEQLADFARKAKNIGMYEYYDVEQWSWDQPGKARAAHLDYHAASMPYFRHDHINSITAEISNNWAPNGIGYYVVSKLMWDAGADVRALEEEFCRTAFGPAAEPLKRCWRRWESGQKIDERTLGLAYRDLREAVKLTSGLPEYRARVDHMRLYLHFLTASLFLQDTPLTGNEAFTKNAVARLSKRYGADAVKQKVCHLGEYVRRLMETNMVHSFAYNTYLTKVGDIVGCDTKNWRKPGVIPNAEEIERIFQEDLKGYDLASLKDVEPRFFSRALVPVKETRPDLIKEKGRKMEAEPFKHGSLFVHAGAGDTVSASFAPNAKAKTAGDFKVSFIAPDAFEKGWAIFGGTQLPAPKPQDGTLRFEAPRAGYYQIEWSEAAVTALSHPAVLDSRPDMGLRGGTFYFIVPRGTTRFVLRPRVTGGSIFVLKDGRGRTILDVDRKTASTLGASPEFVIDVPERADDAIWSLAGLRNGYGNAALTLIGVPSYLSLLPEQLLAPREVLR